MIEFDVFVSYSSHDKPTADAACAALEAAGIRGWIAPRDILPGSDWGASILDALDHCRVMVFIFSSSANTSPQIRREVERVVNRGVPVVPVRIEDIEPTKAMAPLEKHLESLAVSIDSLLATGNPDGSVPKSNTGDASARTGAADGAAAKIATAPQTVKYATLTSLAITITLGLLALLNKDLPISWPSALV
jgi:TIR domain